MLSRSAHVHHPNMLCVFQGYILFIHIAAPAYLYCVYCRRELVFLFHCLMISWEKNDKWKGTYPLLLFIVSFNRIWNINTLLFHILECFCCCCFLNQKCCLLCCLLSLVPSFFQNNEYISYPCMNCHPPPPLLSLSLDIFCPQLDWTLRIMMTECCSAACNTRVSTQSVLSSCAREFFPSPPSIYSCRCRVCVLCK